jgi:hypothetical protein
MKMGDIGGRFAADAPDLRASRQSRAAPVCRRRPRAKGPREEETSMPEVVVSESQWRRWANDRAKHREALRGGERAGWETVKSGKVGKGALMIGGANAPVLQSIFAGAAIYAVATSKWFEDMQFLKDHWYVKPLLILGLGYLLFRRGSPWAAAVISTGAALFVQAWKERPKDGKPAETHGPEDETGRWEWQAHEPRGSWQLGANGDRNWREGAGHAMADRVFAGARA